MKIPDGWVSKPIINRNGTSIDIEVSELVMCHSCIYMKEKGGHANCNGYLKCAVTGKEVDWNDYCSKGEMV